MPMRRGECGFFGLSVNVTAIRRNGAKRQTACRSQQPLLAVSPSSLVVEIWRFLELGAGPEVVLNPELGALLSQKPFDGHSRGPRLFRVELERRYSIEGALLLIVVKIPG